MVERSRSSNLSLLTTLCGLVAGAYMIVGGFLVMQQERAWSTTFWMIEAFKSESIDEVVAWLAIAGGMAVIAGGLLSRRHFTTGGLLMLVVDAGGLFFVYVSPNPISWFYLWALPAVLLALGGVFCGLQLTRVVRPVDESGGAPA
jgi:hypothetical protein